MKVYECKYLMAAYLIEDNDRTCLIMAGKDDNNWYINHQLSDSKEDYNILSEHPVNLKFDEIQDLVFEFGNALIDSGFGTHIKSLSIFSSNRNYILYKLKAAGIKLVEVKRSTADLDIPD